MASTLTQIAQQKTALEQDFLSRKSVTWLQDRIKNLKSPMTLAKEISKEKLVIVVTHNFDEVEQYATRRIRLFDGEVVEDKKTKIATIVENVTAIPAYKMSWLSLVGM